MSDDLSCTCFNPGLRQLHGLVDDGHLVTHSGRVIAGTRDELRAEFWESDYELVVLPDGISPTCTIAEARQPKHCTVPEHQAVT